MGVGVGGIIVSARLLLLARSDTERLLCHVHSWTLGGNFLITIRHGPFPSEIPLGSAS